jgi:8-oxo-dGTP pyrophosphatase MutT (NUDIX family)
MNQPAVVALDRLDLSFAPHSWTFADERRADIDAHFAARQRERPKLWNGRVLLMSRCALNGRSLSGSFFETDFASFLAWRDWNCPDETVTNCFAMGALRAVDGAFVVGVMGDHTANAGRIYFPAGTPEPEDVRGTTVDLTYNVVREIAEETGLTSDDYRAQDGWFAVVMRARVALLKLLHVDTSAEELRQRILDHLARDPEPELADIRIVRGPSDLDPMMTLSVMAFLQSVWRSAP